MKAAGANNREKRRKRRGIFPRLPFDNVRPIGYAGGGAISTTGAGRGEDDNSVLKGGTIK